MTDLINYEAVYRTAPGYSVTGLLKCSSPPARLVQKGGILLFYSRQF